MAFLGTTFDATTVEPARAYEVVPAGKYVVQIVESEVRPTSNGDGQYLWLRLDILDGEHAGKPLFDRLNIINPNPKTVEIAQRTLSSICRAVGELSVSDSEELHFKPMVATVKVEPPRVDPRTGKEYGESNGIKGYAPVNGSAPASRPVASVPPQRPAAVPAAANAAPPRPWKRQTA